MAIKKPGGITPTGDDQNQRVKGISDVSKTVNQMQNRMKTEMKHTENAIENNKDIHEIQSSMNTVLKRLGDTVQTLSDGVKTVTVTTAQATKDAVSQYGKAIGEDIHWKKQNVLAMSLARSTPIFGYFAAKFMETDVFKKAAGRMREQVGKVFSGIGNIFRRKNQASNESKSSKKAGKGKLPVMHEGGYVERGGLAKVRSAEVVMPIEKILDRLDENESVGKQLGIVMKKAGLHGMTNMRTYVQMAEKKARVGMAKGFLRAYSEVHTRYLEPDSKQQLRALLAIQDALGAQIGEWDQVWQKMLLEHPWFRRMAVMSRWAGKFFKIPYGIYKFFVKDRGGYKKIVSKSDNPMVAAAENMGTYLIESLWREDNIVQWTRLTAEATRDLSAYLTGKKYKAVKGLDTGVWSLAGMMKKPFGWALQKSGKLVEKGLRRALLGKDNEGKTNGLIDFLAKERGGGPGLFSSFLTKREYALDEGIGEAGGKGISALQMPQDKMMEQVYPFFVPFYKYGSKYFEEQGKYIDQTFHIQSKLLETTEEQNDRDKREKRKGMFGKLLTFLPIIGNFLFSTFSKVIGGIGDIIKNALPWLASANAFANFLGPAAGVLGAAALGYGIGSLIEKYLISPIRERYFADLEKGKKKAGAQAAKTMNAHMEATARVKAGKGTAKDYQTMKTAGGMYSDLVSMQKDREGFIQGNFWERLTGDRDVYNIVTAAQKGYFGEHMDEYLNYDREEISRQRYKFMAYAKGAGLDYAKDPVKAGRKREQMFLNFLKKHGTPRYDPMTDVTLTQQLGMKGRDLTRKGLKEYEDTKTWLKSEIDPTKKYAKILLDDAGNKYVELKGEVTDFLGGTEETQKMLKDKAMQGLAKINIQTAQIQNGLGQIAGELKEGAGKQVAAINNMTTNVISNVRQNSSTAISKGKEKLSALQDDLTARILHGRMH